MGLFDFVKRKQPEAPREEEPSVTVRVGEDFTHEELMEAIAHQFIKENPDEAKKIAAEYFITLDGDPIVVEDDYDLEQLPKELEEEIEADKKEMEEYMRLKEEGEELRRAALFDAGLDESLFSEDLAIQFTETFLKAFVPSYGLFGFKPIRVTVTHENLTKTGKLPKNVVKYDVDLSGVRKHDFGIAHIKCLKDGRPNLVDMHLWHEHVRHGISIRKVDNDYAITYACIDDTNRGFTKPLYHNNTPSLAELDAVEELDKSIRAMFSEG